MIITAIILIDLSFTLLVIYLLINGRSYYEDKFQTTSYNFAKLYEQIISDKVRLINDATVRVERELNRQLLNGAFDVVRIEQLLDSEQNQLPEIDTIRVTNANGDVLFGKGIVPDKQISYADRDFFKKHRDHTTNDLIITEPMLGKVSNKWIIAFTRCYHNTEGQFAGVISAAVPVEAFGAALSKVNLGPTGTFVMRYIDMGLITRFPAIHGASGLPGNKNVSEEFIKVVESGLSEATFHTARTPDSVERTYSFRRVSGWPFTIAVGLVEEEYLAPWKTQVILVATLLAIFFLVTSFFSWMAVRLLRNHSTLEQKHIDDLSLRRLLIDQSRDGIVILDNQGKVWETNQKFTQMLGYTSEELKRLHVWDWDVRWTQQELLEAIVHIDETGDHFATQHRRKDGSIYDVEISTNGVCFADSKMVFCICRDITNRNRVELIQTFLARNSVGLHSTPFFNKLAEFLAQTLGMDFVCIDYLERDGLTAKTVAVWHDGHFDDNVTYSLKDTPCGEVVENAFCCYPSGVCHLFPNDQVLKEMKAESYAGTTLYCSNGQPIGLIAIISRKPLTDRNFVEMTLNMVAERTAAIMERQQAEVALKESEFRYRALANSGQVLIWTTDISNKCDYCNQTWLKFTGRTLEDELGEGWIKGVHPKDYDQFLSSYKKAFEKRKPFSVEYRLRHCTGLYHWIQNDGAPRFESDGTFLGYIGHCLDITHYKQAELVERSRLKISESSADLSLESLLQMVLDEAEMLTESCIGFFHFLEEDQKTLSLQSWSSNTLSHYCKAEGKGLHYDVDVAGVWVDCIRERKPVIHNNYKELKHRKGLPLGHTPVLREMVVPIMSNNQIVGVLGIGNKKWNYDQLDVEKVTSLGNIAWDIVLRKRVEEEQKKLQVQLLQAQKMEAIGTLAGGIAHDFNNILGAILGYAEMARDESTPGSLINNRLDKVLEAGHRAASLVKQILAFSRQANIERIPLNPGIICKEAIKLIRSTLPATISISQKIDTTICLILADPTQLHQILMNLCTNAYHAMEQTGGILEIVLTNYELSHDELQNHPERHPGAFVMLSVRDSGQGISPEIKDKIFEPYFTTKEQGKGTGMGLAIIHGIVESYGGFITCETEFGKGTVFKIYFPAINQQKVIDDKAVEQTSNGKNEHILLVDDEDMLADLGKSMLESLGYRVTTRTNSLDALATFHDNPDLFDTVITDQTMPGMTGLKLARRILEIRANIPIILCTGYSNIVDEKRAKECGIKEFVMKPMTKNDIATALRKVLDQN